ncbi:hypothetical protein GY45DRAFT_1321614 [Cubamyces sp. BRFM 1775]|nr:hypothetical protein GY45DRAFT_1321614 [Cubamyces sp. BRFM 1775]
MAIARSVTQSPSHHQGRGALLVLHSITAVKLPESSGQSSGEGDCRRCHLELRARRSSSYAGKEVLAIDHLDSRD